MEARPLLTAIAQGGRVEVRPKSLSAYFAKLHPLGAYLSCASCDAVTSATLVRPTDPPDYKSLLQDTICASDDVARLQCPPLEPVQRGAGPTHAEAVDAILHELGRRTYPRTSTSSLYPTGDTLLLGLTNRADPDLPINPSRPAFEHRYANSPSTVLRSLPWKILRTRIGDAAFRHVLLHTSVFLSVGNSCFLQLSGRPMHELYKHDELALNGGKRSECSKMLARKSDDVGEADNGHKLRCVKRRKRSAGKPSDLTQIEALASENTRQSSKGCADRAILRGRMFYGSPSRISPDRLLHGLPAAHILNTLSASTAPTDLAPLILLRAIFTSPILFAAPGFVPLEQLSPAHFKLRGSQARSQPLLGFARELLARHSAFDYAAAVRRCAERIAGDDDGIDGGKRKFEGLKAVSKRNVERFVAAWWKSVVSGEMIGQGNVDVLLTHMKRFMGLNQYEPVNLHEVMQGLKTANIPFLAARQTIQSEAAIFSAPRPSVSAALKDTAIVRDLVFWIFNDLLIPLLRNTFYITETASTRYTTVYYLHEHWEAATRPHFAALGQELLEPLSSDDAYFAKHSTLGVAAVRLVPKPNNGFRPIVNLGKRINPSQETSHHGHGLKRAKGTEAVRAYNSIPIAPQPDLHSGAGSKAKRPKLKSANQVLRDVHQILMYERERNRANLGNTLFGTNEVFAPVRDLKRELLAVHEKLPRLYFVKMDIRAAFDTIDQDRMLEVVEDLLDRHHDYCLILYALLLPPASKASQGSARRLFKTKAVSDGDTSCTSGFGTHARTVAAPMRNAVLVDLMRRKRVSKDKCLELLRAHVKQNVWQMDGQLLRQRQGIPQGSKVSSLLCSFFYAAMEREHLGFLAVAGTRLLRYIDDFLLITPSRDLAERFVHRMNEGFPAYGAFVSRHKTLLSFECLGQGTMEEVCVQDEWFPYCGFMINTRTLDLSMDFSRSLSGPIRQTFALRSNRHIGSGFLDTQHNSLDTVRTNVFLNFALTGMKVPQYFARWSSVPRQRTKVRSDASSTGAGKGEGSRAMVAEQRELDRRSSMITKSLRLAIDYTYVAGRARVKHTARLDAKRSGQVTSPLVSRGSAGDRKRHRDDACGNAVGDIHHPVRPAAKRARLGDVAVADRNPVGNNEASCVPACAAAKEENHDPCVHDSDREIAREPTRPTCGGDEYGITRSEFTFLALAALRLCIQRKAADPLWTAVIRELDAQMQGVRRRLAGGSALKVDDLEDVVRQSWSRVKDAQY